MRQRHWLLRHLPLRVVINHTQLYELPEEEPVAINFSEATVTLLVTNGFHASEPLQLSFEAGSTYFFQIDAVLNNKAMAAMAVLSLLLFGCYALNGSGLLLAAANLPVLALVWVFFLQPRSALVLKAWSPKTASSEKNL